MNTLKTLGTIIGSLFLFIMNIQCASSQKIEESVDNTAPIELKEMYFMNWMSGIREGGTGFNIYISADESSDVILEYVYFKGKKVKLNRKPNAAIYVGKYTDKKNSKGGDLIMSSDPKEEFKNTLPVIEEKIPFQLAEGACIIEYTKSGKKGHFTIDNLPEKKVQGIQMQSRQ